LQASDFLLSTIHDGYKIPFFVYAIAAAPDWDTDLDLDEFCLVEVNFWQENLTALNNRQFIKPVCSHSKIVYSDASSYACGALIQGSEQFISHTMFSDQERSLSSTHGELIVINYSLQAFEDKLFRRLRQMVY